jgi:ASC-1-like (ASCH) protein
MRLHPEPFDKIEAGVKTVELRLNDEKRRIIKAGDHIEFSRRPDFVKKIKTEVVGLDVFDSFEKAYVGYSADEYGEESENNWKIMYEYYSPEDETKYGVLGIRLHRLS